MLVVRRPLPRQRRPAAGAQAPSISDNPLEHPSHSSHTSLSDSLQPNKPCRYPKRITDGCRLRTMMWPGVDRNTAHPWPAGRNLHLTVTVGDGERKVIVEGGRKSLRQ